MYVLYTYWYNDHPPTAHSLQVATFNELVDLSGDTPEDDSYKALTALGIIMALQSLVKATFNQPRVIRDLRNVTLWYVQCPYRARHLQWNLVNTNSVKAKYLLNTNHFESIITLIQCRPSLWSTQNIMCVYVRTYVCM